MATEPIFLRHYTQLPQAVHLLKTRSLILGDPQHWDDQNDAVLIEKYREKRGLEKVFALCFTEASETYHHWKIYAEGVSGVCIEFSKDRLLDTIPSGKGFRHGLVKYVRVDTLGTYQDRVGQWPFLKRLPFSGEKEYRLIFGKRKEGNDGCQVGFDLKAINHIYLSPWVHRDTADSVAEMIRYLPNCAELNVTKTTLVSNRRWSSALTAR